MPDRVVLHSDINNFYASVECLRFPEYADKPLAVAGDPEKRHGIILAKNQKAKTYGVRTGEALWEAEKKCPGLICVPPHFEDYMRISEQVFEIYTRYTNLVEAFGADECWLDVTGSQKLFGNGLEIAQKISADIKRETRLTVSIGVSWNKVFSKLGSDYKKPDAITEITRDNFQRLLFPLDCGELFMVGKATAAALKKMNINTIGGIASAPEDIMKYHFGINGLKLKAWANGDDNEPVREYFVSRVPESIGHGITAARDLLNLEEVKIVVYYLADLIAARMRKNGFKGSRLSVSLRDNELQHLTRQGALPVVTNSGRIIAESAIRLVAANWMPDKDLPLRTITVSVFALENEDSAEQLDMFETEKNQKLERLDRGIDNIRGRFGSSAVVRANLIGQPFIYDKIDAEDFLPFKR